MSEVQGNVNNLQTGDMVEFSILTNQVNIFFHFSVISCFNKNFFISFSAMENHLDVMLLKSVMEQLLAWKDYHHVLR